MSISSEITRISNAKTAIAESIANKGVTVPDGTKIDGMATLIDSIETGGGGDTSETWLLNESVDTATKQTFECSFGSNGETFSKMVIGGMGVPGSSGIVYSLYFDDTKVADGGLIYTTNPYRKIVFPIHPSGELLVWLEANAVKQESAIVLVEEEKFISINSNGDLTISPDGFYDAMKKVTVSVNATECRITLTASANFQILYKRLDSSGLWNSSNLYLSKGINYLKTSVGAPFFLAAASSSYRPLLSGGENILAANGTMQDGSYVYYIYYTKSKEASATVSITSV